jgi:hypothetical protein
LRFSSPIARRGGGHARRSQLAGAPSEPGGTAQNWTWHFIALVEIVNFAILRRLIGRSRGDALVLDLEQRIAATLPAAATMVVGRATIEVSFDGATFADLEVANARWKLRSAGSAHRSA